MARFLLAVLGTAFFVLVILSVLFLKDSYKVLPTAGSDPRLVSQFADWQLFKDPKGGFDAEFPTIPQHASQIVRDPKTGNVRDYNMYVAEKSNGTIFMVSLVDFPDTKEPIETLKKTLVNDLLKSNPLNQLKSMQVGSYKLFKTIDFTITSPTMTINGRTFSDGNLLYLLTGIFTNPFYDQSEYDFFINSFEWRGPL